jgi:hypothetical protein
VGRNDAVHLLAVTLMFLALADAPFAGDKRTMEYIETYKGHRITVTTTRDPNGRWKAAARIGAPGDKTISAALEPTESPDGKPFRSEEDAKAAALRAAVTAIDRSRVSVGKP